VPHIIIDDGLAAVEHQLFFSAIDALELGQAGNDVGLNVEAWAS
jgi:hypothetical protein